VGPFPDGSLIGVIVSGLLLLFSLTRFLGALRERAWFEGIFMLAVVAALVYTVSALLTQHKFFKKWERRIGLLMHMEEKILKEELKNDE
jgi:high-affinity Fe2+/Pb2+ permease